MNNQAILVLAIILPLNIIFAAMPYLSRKNLSFSISIPSAKWGIDEFKRIRRNYVLIVIAITILIAGAAFILINMNEAALISAGIFLNIALFYLAFFYSRKKTKAIKEEFGWEEDARDITITEITNDKSSKAPSLYIYLIYILVILGTIIMGYLLYPNAPDEIIMQTNLQGEVSSVIQKSTNLLLYVPAVQAFLAIVFLFSHFAIAKSASYVDPADPKTSAKAGRKHKRIWITTMFIGGLMMLLLFTFVQYSMFKGLDNAISGYVALGFTLVFVIGIVLVTVKTGQSGSRLAKTKDSETINRKDEKYWKAGIIYFNKKDPAIFVEKRFSIGWTINFAKWPSAVIIAVIIAVVVFSLLR